MFTQGLASSEEHTIPIVRCFGYAEYAKADQ